MSLHSLLRPALAAALAVGVVGCAAHPLGEDWRRLDRAERRQRAVDVLAELFAGGLDGSGSVFRDREVLEADAEAIVYQAEGRRSRLAWRDVKGVEATPLLSLPTRPESLFVYLDGESPRLDEVADLVRPPLAGIGLARPYVELRSRPAWSRNRFVRALSVLRQRQEPGAAVAAIDSAAAPSASPAGQGAAAAASAAKGGAGGERAAPVDAATAEPAAPPAGELEAVEAKLRRLKAWHDQGLIDEAEYRAKRQELLDQL